MPWKLMGKILGISVLDNYRSQTTLIDAKPVFFGATIEENLRKVQPNISEREFQEILDISGLSKGVGGITRRYFYRNKSVWTTLITRKSGYRCASEGVDGKAKNIVIR